MSGTTPTTTCMAVFSRGDVILVRYPLSDLSSTKVRPALVVSAPHPSQDLLIVPLTSRVGGLSMGEFVLPDWAGAGLNVATAVKRGIYTVHERLALKTVGRLSAASMSRVEASLRGWLSLS